MKSIKNQVVSLEEKINEVQKDNIYFESLYSDLDKPNGKNDFLFFIKPEITLNSDKIQLNQILNLFFNKFIENDLSVHSILVLSANYLNDYSIISKHYGVINKLASNAAENLSEIAKIQFQKIYKKSIDKVKVLGGLEFLKLYNEFNPISLDYLWQNKKCERLAGGTYVLDIKIDNEVIFLINGFHPRQLEQYIAKGRSIIVMMLSGDISWSDARTNLIGATFPDDAKKGSIRRELLDKKEEFGLDEVSQAYNGVHLSAGPVESLVELCRFNSNFSKKNMIKTYDDFTFGKTLSKYFDEVEIESILANENIIQNEKSISIFDLTEEKDSSEAIALLKMIYNK